MRTVGRLFGLSTLLAATAAVNVFADVSLPLVSEAERSAHFQAVNQHLELGGVFYGYVDIDGDMAAGGKKLSELAERFASLQPQLALAKQDYATLFGMLGLTDVKAVGLSSVATGNGLYRNRTFFYTPKGRQGLLNALGGAPHAFDEARIAPADADVFSEGDVDLPTAYGAIKNVLTKVGGDALLKTVEAALEKKTPSGIVPMDLINSLSGHVVAFARVDPNQTLNIPGPKPTKIPGVSFLIQVDGVASALEAAIAQNKMLAKSNEGSVTIYEAPDFGLGATLRPVLAVSGKNLLLANSRAFLTECLARNDGGLAKQKNFQDTLTSLGGKGNGLVYVTPRFFESIRKALNDVAAQNPEAQLMMQGWIEAFPPITAPLISLRTNEADGILFRSTWNQSLKHDVATVIVANPVTIGMLAATAVPAFQKVRSNSQQKSVQNNLRQFEAAAQQYMLENSKEEATYEDVVGPDKLLKELKPVAGEDYTQLVMHVNDEDLSIELGNGEVVHSHQK